MHDLEEKVGGSKETQVFEKAWRRNELRACTWLLVTVLECQSVTDRNMRRGNDNYLRVTTNEFARLLLTPDRFHVVSL